MHQSPYQRLLVPRITGEGSFTILALILALVMIPLVINANKAPSLQQDGEFVTHGASMEPTLHDRERFTLHAAADYPRAGEVAVIDPKRGEDALQQILQGYGGGGSGKVVKRIFAMSGDSITFTGSSVQSNNPDVNDIRLPEGYKCSATPGRYQVPAGMVFVAGDNTLQSSDSIRAWCNSGDVSAGFIPRETLVAWGQIEKVEAPAKTP